MTSKEIYYDIQRLLQGSSLNIASAIEDRQVLEKFGNYRAQKAKEYYLKENNHDPVLIQEARYLRVTKIDGNSNPFLAGSDIIIGKVTIPTPIQILENNGIIRIASCDYSDQYNITDPNSFYEVKNPRIKQWPRYWLVGNTLHLHPYKPFINVMSLFEDPLDVPFITEEYVAKFTIGVNYTVVSGSIVSNSITYQEGQSFDATVETFTGNGLVLPTNYSRAMTVDDEYPVSKTMVQEIIEFMLRIDFGFERSSSGDIKNDMANQKSITDEKAQS